jgi:saxitoxin biosynthesis operon SxtJ-like protein
VQATASSRAFGLLIAALLAVVAAMDYRWAGHGHVYWIGAAALCLLISLAMPRVLAPVKRLWLKLGHVLHRLISPLILAAVYVLAFIPVGAALRLFGKDVLALKRDPRAASYWSARAGGPAPESLKDQF